VPPRRATSRRSSTFASSPDSSMPRTGVPQHIGTRPVRRRAESTRLCNTARQDRGLLERLERDAHEAASARDRPQHDTLRIEKVQPRPGAGFIAIIAQRHLEADLRVLNQRAVLAS
jgi:hypothetical protein